MLETAFDLILEGVRDVDSRASGDAFLREVRSLYGLTNAAYLGVNIPDATHGSHYVQCTYSADWVEHYVAQDFVRIDPVVHRGLTHLLPLDWAELRRINPAAAVVFNEARDFGLGHQGVTFPIRGLHGETAIFSVNADVGNREWKDLRRTCMRDFQLIAHYFHIGILKSAGVGCEEDRPELSPRERECLTWSAEGKTAVDIGDILGISNRTVEVHLFSARTKLNALTLSQAVAKALCYRLIAPTVA